MKKKIIINIAITLLIAAISFYIFATIKYYITRVLDICYIYVLYIFIIELS